MADITSSEPAISHAIGRLLRILVISSENLKYRGFKLFVEMNVIRIITEMPDLQGASKES